MSPNLIALIDPLPVLPEVILLLGACALMIVDLFVKDARRGVSFALAQLVLLACVLLAYLRRPAGPRDTSWTGPTMGTRYTVSLADSPLDAVRLARLKRELEAYLETANQQMSTYLPGSEISRFNTSRTTEPFAVSEPLARVTQLKSKGEQNYLGVATGMNSLIRPALYGAYHRIVNLSRLNEKPSVRYTVVGPICESGDVLGESRMLPPAREGDVMLVANAGAYGRAMASHYNRRDPAEELVIDG